MSLSERFQGADGSRTRLPMLAWSPPERRGEGTGVEGCVHTAASWAGLVLPAALFQDPHVGPGHTGDLRFCIHPLPVVPQTLLLGNGQLLWRLSPASLLTQRLRVTFQARAGKKEAFLLEACFFLSPSKFLGLLRAGKDWE